MIEIRGLTVELGDFAISDFDLEVEDGGYFVVLGPTGVGKTVLLETIAGLRRPQSGRIVLGGRDVTLLPPEQRGFGFVYQDYALFPHMDVRENIAFGLRMKKVPRADRKRKADEAAETLGIRNLLNRSPMTLSGGEQQRVAIARAIVTAPRAFLLDEPLGALDPKTAKDLQVELKRVHAALGTTVIHVTHNFEEAIALGDRVGVMLGGRIAQAGPPTEVFGRPASLDVARFLGVHNILRGTVVKESDGCYFSVGRILLPDAEEHAGRECHLAIPPEDVILSHERFESSARNRIRATISDLVLRQAHVEVHLNIGHGKDIVALITKRSLKEMGLAEGVEVWATFKTAAVRLYP